MDKQRRFDVSMSRAQRADSIGAFSREKVESMLLDVLPHGSGIDYDWEFDWCENGTLYCANAYHRMDDYGFYCEIVPLRVRIFRHRLAETRELIGPCLGKIQILHRPGDLDWSVKMDNRHGLRDYVEECLSCAFEELIPYRHEIMTISDWRAEQNQ